MYDPNSAARAQAISDKRAGFLYGPSILGNTSFFPTGPLGDAMVQRDVAQLNADSAVVATAAEADAALVVQALQKVTNNLLPISLMLG